MKHACQTAHSPPLVIASGWLEQQLPATLSNIRRRLFKHMLLTASGSALLSGLGGVALVSIGSGLGSWQLSGGADAAVLAAATLTMAAAALYPVLRQQEHWLMRTVSTITHDNFEQLLVLGKLTQLRSGETAGHHLRVTLYTFLFAEALELPPEAIIRTVKGALLHDVGKLAVADGILEKPGQLTPGERAEMQKHVAYGLEIIGQSQVLNDAAPVVGAHHERYDGLGYPRGLKGEAIPREARLFALVDVFDALMSRRAYKPAFSIEEALATMAAGRGTQFDPVMFDRFVALAPEFARSLPKDEPALARLMMERLLPYFELLVLERAMPPSRNGGQAPAAIGASVPTGVEKP